MRDCHRQVDHAQQISVRPDVHVVGKVTLARVDVILAGYHQPSNAAITNGGPKAVGLTV